jgi:hypothetical protein
MEDLLRSRALWRITLETQVAPLDALKEDNWENKNDESHGLFSMSIYRDMKFHLQGIDKPEESWTKPM